jgi:hypothetical protein
MDPVANTNTIVMQHINLMAQREETKKPGTRFADDDDKAINRTPQKLSSTTLAKAKSKSHK